MDQLTLQVLLGHNPWLIEEATWPETPKRHLPERYIQRRPVSSLRRQNNRINLVVGPRQSGKSTFIWHQLSSSAFPVLTFNCEERLCR